MKEASEELGLDLSKYEVLPVATIKRQEPQNYCFSHHFYILENKPANEYQIQEEELSEVLYIPYEKFKNMILSSSDEVSYKYELGEYDKLFCALDHVMYD